MRGAEGKWGYKLRLKGDILMATGIWKAMGEWGLTEPTPLKGRELDLRIGCASKIVSEQNRVFHLSCLTVTFSGSWGNQISSLKVAGEAWWSFFNIEAKDPNLGKIELVASKFLLHRDSTLPDPANQNIEAHRWDRLKTLHLMKRHLA